MSRIATLTLNPTIDKSCSVEQVVAERKLRCDEPTCHPGGGGINVARAITELGGEVTAYWTRGGVIGELLERLLEEERVEHHPIPIRGMTRENLIVFDRSSGEQFRFGMPGAALSEEELESCLDCLRAIDPPPEYLVLSGSLPPGADARLYARVAGAMPPSCRVVLDTSGRPLALGLDAPIYLIKPNVRELQELADRPIESDAQIRAVAEAVIHEGRAQVVVTSLGSGGVVLTTSDEHRQIRAPTVRIRSKVGAGDSTVAGILLGLSRGKDIVEATRFGVAAGAAAVMTDGTELCRREDTEMLYGEMVQSSR